MGYFEHGFGATKPTASKGAEIRARIAENRRKRLAIAEAMKAEAGVAHHDINEINLDGIAYFEGQRIYSPLGLNMKQLFTLAHECGHIFLHSDWPGRDLPTHVKEMEAECYAHHAFVAHGMSPPKWLTEDGRAYVQSWIDRDRAQGVAIDVRAVAYASGVMSPYEPLRFVPRGWPGYRPRPAVVWSEIPAATAAAWPRFLYRAKRLLGFAAHHLLMGLCLSYLGLKIGHAITPMPQLFEGEAGMPTISLFVLCLWLAAIWLLTRTYLRLFFEPRLSALENR